MPQSCKNLEDLTKESYKSETGEKSQKEPMPSRKKLTKSPKLSTQNQLQGTELPLVLDSASQIKESCNRQRITPLTQWVVRIYGAEKGATEGGKSPSTGEYLVVPLMRSEISYLRLEKKLVVFVERLDSLVPRVLVYVHICAQSEQKNSRGHFRKRNSPFVFGSIDMLHIGFLFPVISTGYTCRVSP